MRKDVLVPISAEQFANYVTGVSGTCSELDESISSQEASFWRILRKEIAEYDRKQEEAIASHLVTKDETIKLCNKYIARDGSKRRVVSQAFGSLPSFADREPLGDDVVSLQDPVAFRRQNELHPVQYCSWPAATQNAVNDQ